MEKGHTRLAASARPSSWPSPASVDQKPSKPPVYSEKTHSPAYAEKVHWPLAQAVSPFGLRMPFTTPNALPSAAHAHLQLILAVAPAGQPLRWRASCMKVALKHTRHSHRLADEESSGQVSQILMKKRSKRWGKSLQLLLE